MKVATLWFEMTLQSSLRTPNTSSGTCTSMSCFTVTWQDRRQFSSISRRDRMEASVGSTAPPPESTCILH